MLDWKYKCVVASSVLLICMIAIGWFFLGFEWSEKYEKSIKTSICDSNSELLFDYLGSLEKFPNVSKIDCAVFSPNFNYFKSTGSCDWLRSTNVPTGQYIFDTCTTSKVNLGSNDVLLYHTLWIIQKNFTPPTFLIDSFLITQQMQRSKLSVWILANNESEAIRYSEMYSKVPSNVLQFKLLNISYEFRDSCVVNGNFLDYLSTKVANGKKFHEFSDIASIFLLRNYGGIWVDPDLLLLKDLRPFVVSFGEFSLISSDRNYWKNHVMSFEKSNHNILNLATTVCEFPYNETIDETLQNDPDQILRYWPLKPMPFDGPNLRQKDYFQWSDGVFKSCLQNRLCNFHGLQLAMFDPQL